MGQLNSLAIDIDSIHELLESGLEILETYYRIERFIKDLVIMKRPIEFVGMRLQSHQKVLE